MPSILSSRITIVVCDMPRLPPQIAWERRSQNPPNRRSQMKGKTRIFQRESNLVCRDELKHYSAKRGFLSGCMVLVGRGWESSTKDFFPRSDELVGDLSRKILWDPRLVIDDQFARIPRLIYFRLYHKFRQFKWIDSSLMIISLRSIFPSSMQNRV